MKEGTFVLDLEGGRQKEQHEQRHGVQMRTGMWGIASIPGWLKGRGSQRGSWKPAKMGPTGHSKEHKLALPRRGFSF